MKTVLLFSLMILTGMMVFSQTTEKEVMKENLSPVITNHIKTAYPDAQINNAFMITKDGVTTYKVKINQKGTVLNLYYDNAFNFIKQEAVSSKPAETKSKGKGKSTVKEKTKATEKSKPEEKEKEEPKTRGK